MDSDDGTACAVGCPIRRSRDQRSLASPPGFSQRATSFIASQCQGIHQMPFVCARTPHPTARTIQISEVGYHRSEPRMRQTLLSEDTAGSRMHSLTAAHGLPLRSHNSLLHNLPSTTPPPVPRGTRPGQTRLHAARIAPQMAPNRWCPDGGGDRARTDDPLLAKQVLSQLSYTPGPEIRKQRSEIRIAAPPQPVVPGRRCLRF